jgi:DNA-binding NarL/FixJ family response regulator
MSEGELGATMAEIKQKRKLRMIVADDAPFIREIIRRLAIKNDIALVGEAIDGNEAVALAEELKPDLVLMDIIMPRMNGIEATKEILLRFPKMKVVAFSTADQETMVIRALDAGCCNYIIKPFDGPALLTVIRKSFGNGK